MPTVAESVVSQTQIVDGEFGDEGKPAVIRCQFHAENDGGTGNNGVWEFQAVGSAETNCGKFDVMIQRDNRDRRLERAHALYFL
jgi:hypothetical protein